MIHWLILNERGVCFFLANVVTFVRFAHFLVKRKIKINWWAHFPRGLFALCSQPEAVALGASWGSWQEKMSTAAKPKKLTRAAKKSPLLASPSTASARNWFRKIDSIAVSPFVDYLVEHDKYRMIRSNYPYWGEVLHAIDKKTNSFRCRGHKHKSLREWWRVEEGDSNRTPAPVSVWFRPSSHQIRSHVSNSQLVTCNTLTLNSVRVWDLQKQCRLFQIVWERVRGEGLWWRPQRRANARNPLRKQTELFHY